MCTRGGTGKDLLESEVVVSGVTALSFKTYGADPRKVCIRSCFCANFLELVRAPRSVGDLHTGFLGRAGISWMSAVFTPGVGRPIPRGMRRHMP